MSAQQTPPSTDRDAAPGRCDGAEKDVRVFDAVVVGAGWAGMYLLIRLRELGMSVRVLEMASGVGGTWYWNAYPGSRCDVPVVGYSYSFSPELEQEWEWTEKYATQPELERYANHVADRFDLRRDIQLDTTVTSASYDETRGRWRIETDRGEVFDAQFCIMATGGYSAPVVPDIPGIEDFDGELYFSNAWPRDRQVTYAGKRIGVVGTGSSGMQTVTALGQEPVEHLYVFQRTPNYAQPAHNGPWHKADLDKFKKRYREFRAAAKVTGGGNPLPPKAEVGPVADLSEEDFQARMRRAVSPGGTGVGGVTDTVTSKTANSRVSEFLRQEVRRRVHDPEVAEKLCAKGHWLFARRDLYEIGYYETYNQPTVTLVDVRSDPIQRIMATGIETGAASYDLDMIILATGFDSGSGALMRIDITGRGGITIQQKWADGPDTYLGLMLHGFPNMFSIAGPGSPSIRSNVMVSIEQHVEWVADLLAMMRQNDVTVIEPTLDAEQAWTRHVNDMVDGTLLMENDTQYNGANVPGKPRVFVAYIGGVAGYRVICDRVREAGYEGFVMSRSDGSTLPTSPTWSGPPTDEGIPTRFGIPFM